MNLRFPQVVPSNILLSSRFMAVRRLSDTSVRHLLAQPYQTSNKALPPWNHRGRSSEVKCWGKGRSWAASGRRRSRCELSAMAERPSCSQSDLDRFSSISRMLRVRTRRGLRNETWKRGSRCNLKVHDGGGYDLFSREAEFSWRLCSTCCLWRFTVDSNGSPILQIVPYLRRRQCNYDITLLAVMYFLI